MPVRVRLSDGLGLTALNKGKKRILECACVLLPIIIDERECQKPITKLSSPVYAAAHCRKIGRAHV